MKGVYIFLADGFEETEALAPFDILKRGKVDVHTVTINPDPMVIGSHGITLVADLTFDDLLETADLENASSEDVMIFPGGMPGTKNLAAAEELISLMNKHYSQGGSVAAICAAPGLVLSQLEGICGKRFTCFDGFEDAPKAKGGIYVQAPAVTDGNVITGRGAGCAIDFGFAILSHLKDEATVAATRHGMMI